MIDKLINLYDDAVKSQRVESLQQLAREYGFNFRKRLALSTQPADLQQMEAFAKKGNKRLLGILTDPTEEFEGQIRFYDYLRTKDLETTTQSMIEIYCPRYTSDAFKIEPRGIIGKMSAAFSMSSRIHSSEKGFHSTFSIETESLDPERTLPAAALRILPDFPNLTVEGWGNFFLFYRKNKELDLAQILPLLDFSEAFVARLQEQPDGDFV